MSRGKLISDAYKSIDIEKHYSIKDAVEVLIKNKRKKFDETVEISMNLGIDPRHADQMVRGSLSLPNGIGKNIKVAVFAKDKQAQEAIYTAVRRQGIQRARRGSAGRPKPTLFL